MGGFKAGQAEPGQQLQDTWAPPVGAAGQTRARVARLTQSGHTGLAE